jgi:hypothetical protein
MVTLVRKIFSCMETVLKEILDTEKEFSLTCSRNRPRYLAIVTALSASRGPRRAQVE